MLELMRNRLRRVAPSITAEWPRVLQSTAHEAAPTKRSEVAGSLLHHLDVILFLWTPGISVQDPPNQTKSEETTNLPLLQLVLLHLVLFQ